MLHAGDLYEAGHEAGVKGLPPSPPADSLDASLYLSGYADAQSEVLALLVRNLIPRSATIQEGF
jgi:hypothetical protein